MKHKTSHTTTTQKPRLVLPIFIALILIFSIFGIIFSSPSPTPAPSGQSGTLDYQGHIFQQTSQGWTATINGFEAIFVYTPLDLRNITLETRALTDLRTAEKIYLTRNPQNTYYGAERDFFVNLKPFHNVFFACTEDNTACTDQPIKTCDDADSTTMVVRLDLNEHQGAAYEPSCFTITGTPEHITRVIDAHVLASLGLM